MDFNGPLFIVGLPRSGTKLLRSLLCQHSCIRIPDIETEFLPYINSLWGKTKKKCNYEEFYQFYKKIEHQPFFYFQNKHHRSVNPRQWYANIENFSVSNIFEALIKTDQGIEGRNDMIWGDKSPYYIEHIDLLAGMFPQAKFIHIVRDVRDYALSINKAWGKNPIRAAFRWSDSIKKARKDANNISDRYYEVFYESLLDHPETTLKEITSYIGIDFENEMLSLKEPSENIGDAKGITSIVVSNKGKYEKKRKGFNLKKIEENAFEVMKSCGYQPISAQREKKITKIQLFYYRILDGINLLNFEMKEKGLLEGAKLHLNFLKSRL